MARSARRAAAAADALRALVRDIAEREFVTTQLPDGELELTVRMRVAPKAGWGLHFAPSLNQQVVEQLGDTLAERGIYREGAVYCFRCGTSGCGHAVPPSPRQVFAGYGSTGLPEYHDLPQAFLRAHDERVHHLYAEIPFLAALVESGKDLKAQQLSSFGRASKAYALLGQVTAGYFTRGTQAGGAERFAVSFQFVETRTASGQVALRVNPVCRLPGGGTLADFHAEVGGDWVHRAHAKASELLDEMARRINEAGPDRYRTARATLVKVPAIMRRFAASLDRGHRQTRRRTQHAEQRRREQRPVQKAWEDARDARDTDLLYEERTDAVVVAGPQYRLHVFSTTGRHMTSFVGKPDTIKHRLRSQRWRPLEPTRAAAFRQAIALAAREDAAPPGDRD
jgi:hypothetical protein